MFRSKGFGNVPLAPYPTRWNVWRENRREKKANKSPCRESQPSDYVLWALERRLVAFEYRVIGVVEYNEYGDVVLSAGWANTAAEELFSKLIYDLNGDDAIPPIYGYVPETETAMEEVWERVVEMKEKSYTRYHPFRPEDCEGYYALLLPVSGLEYHMFNDKGLITVPISSSVDEVAGVVPLPTPSHSGILER